MVHVHPTLKQAQRNQSLSKLYDGNSDLTKERLNASTCDKTGTHPCIAIEATQEARRHQCEASVSYLRFVKTFLKIVMPCAGLVRMLSGWNWTAANGSSL